MERSPAPRILFNAEPFGFGPSAAIAAIAAPFVQAGRHSYAGVGHSLDLQRHLAYEAVHDLTDRGADAWTTVLRNFDGVVTAMDAEVAFHALAMKMPVVFYDALAWHWPEGPRWEAIKALISHPDCLYLAQDFFGVRERLAPFRARDYRVVPPLVTRAAVPTNKREADVVLLNLGGLRNPYMHDQLLIDFAKVAASALQAALPNSASLRMATSQLISGGQRSDRQARSYPPGEVAAMLNSCRFAVCTPGLGNIYDAAASGKPVIWLPPANNTQGQQLAHLRQAGLVDADIDWSALGETIDYYVARETCLQRIGKAMEALNDAVHGAAFESAMRNAVAVVAHAMPGRMSKLMERFGAGGDTVAVSEIQTWFDSRQRRANA